MMEWIRPLESSELTWRRWVRFPHGRYQIGRSFRGFGIATLAKCAADGLQGVALKTRSIRVISGFESLGPIACGDSIKRRLTGSLEFRFEVWPR